ncbi:hypothetical protein ABTK91_20615, partial [Acinetobacter baumannii]
MAGAALWGLLCCVPSFYASIELRVLLASAGATAYCGAAAAEIWRGRAERLASRISAGVVLGLHGA